MTDAASHRRGQRRERGEDEERRRAGRTFAQLLEALPNPIIEVDRRGRIVTVSSQAEALFGYARQELLGQPVEMLVPERFRGVHGHHRDAFFEAPASRPMGAGRDLFGLRKDGREVPIEIGLNPVGTGEEVVVLASIIDITERKRAEERLRLVIEAAPSAMLMVDNKGRITLVNSQTEQLFGYRRTELLGQPVEMLVPERYRANHPGFHRSFFADPAARPMGAGRDLYGLRKDGSEVPLEIGLNPIRTEDGPAVLASVIDITERREAAERLETSLREKEVLLREIHHRVKNNLAVIGSLLYLSAGTTDDPETLRILEDCRDRVRSMALVHEQIYLSPNLGSVDFATYSTELTRELVSNHSPASVEIKLELDFEPLHLDIDLAIPCGLILAELVSNAVKHAFVGRDRGRLRASLYERDGRAVLSVADDGIGPPEESDGSDTSLGLRLVRSLATQIGARFELLGGRGGTEAKLTWEHRNASHS